MAERQTYTFILHVAMYKKPDDWTSHQSQTVGLYSLIRPAITAERIFGI